MKKLFALIIAVLLICSCSVAASAEEAKYHTAGDLYEAWCEDLPDYICGIWSTDGGTENLTFGIQNNDSGNAGKQEMLALIEDDSSITFVYQVYSRSYLLQIQQEIDVYLQKDLGLIFTGLDELNNCIELGILAEEKNNTATRNMICEITGKYGSAVRVSDTNAIIRPTSRQENDYQAHSLLFCTVAILLTVFAGTFLVIAQRKRSLLLQRNNGARISAAAPPSAKEVEAMVKNTTYDIPPELDQRILDAIRKNM